MSSNNVNHPKHYTSDPSGVEVIGISKHRDFCIERMEELLSNCGDTNDYFGYPSYVVSGEIEGFAEKGEQGKVYNGTEMLKGKEE